MAEVVRYEDMNDASLVSVGVASKILGAHIRTLRIYDEQKLLVPSRSERNRRAYSKKDIEKAQFIMFLTKNLAVNLAGVKVILKLMEANGIKQELYLDYIKNMAEILGISEEEQELNKKIMENRCKGSKAL